MDVMIDLETLATDTDAVVVSIGACFFDVEALKLGPTFYMIPTMQDQLNVGRKISPDTLKWWMGQEDAAKTVFNDKAKPTSDVLNTFGAWLRANGGGKKGVKPWGNGATFDISIMEAMFKSFNIECPWMYYGARDLRTFKEYVAGGAKVEVRSGVKHNALDDAIAQAEYVLEHLRRSRANKAE